LSSWIGFAALIAVLVFGVQVGAQVISGDLVGTVYDKTGAVVPNASVEVLNVATGVKYTASANETGDYRFTNLPVGFYNISAESSSFAKTTVNNFKIELNKTSTCPLPWKLRARRLRLRFRIDSCTDTTTATIANTFEDRLNSDLPAATIGNGVLNLSLLGSGVASSGGVGAGTGPSVGGQRPRNNNFMIEGVDNNSKSVTGPLVGIPNDAVAEFSVLQNQYSPEFGHSSGAQFNTIIKSGTNTLHGGAYIYSQNRNFNAIDVALKNQGITENPRFDSNRIGGDIGGPIVKNKLFFFGAVQYNPVGQASVSAAALCSPTTAGYTQLQNAVTANGFSQTNLDILQQYSVPGAASCARVQSSSSRTRIHNKMEKC
jgi:hypothetical protein